MPAVRDRDASGVLEVRVAERFRPGAEPDDDDAYPLDDEKVDLTDLVRDAVVLELPLAPAVPGGLRGAVPDAAGRTATRTRARASRTTDPRWATLDALRVPDQA